MTIHELRCWPEYFEPVATGAKTLELRRDDRGYAVGDTLLLREYEPATLEYSGRSVMALVTHIVRGGDWLSPGYVAMSIQITDPAAVKRVHTLFMQKLAAEFPDHPWLKKENV